MWFKRKPQELPRGCRPQVEAVRTSEPTPQSVSEFHADCSACCSQGRCHFCLGIARESWKRSDGVTVQVCGAHDIWLKTDLHAPVQGRREIPAGLPTPPMLLQ